MPKLTTQLTFFDNKTKPDYKGQWQYECVIYNKCDGYHLVYARFFSDDNSFDGFYDWAGSSEYETDFYEAWAELPDGITVLYPAFAGDDDE